MHKHSVAFDLPVPWTAGRFESAHFGYLNFLVGPNGSGKSRFAAELKSHLPNARLLGTDRLAGMEQNTYLRNVYGDNLASGFSKGHFEHFKSAGQSGSGIDTIVLLEERADLRIQVEATLGHLFDRKIRLEWDSGHLQAFASIGSGGASYRLDRDECHGIKELFVLLTHLYNDQHPYLIIDEPELNLHPQYQAFFLQEVRKIAGEPQAGTSKKVVFLVTHSPFVLDFRSIEDVKAVITFASDRSPPRRLPDLDAAATKRLGSLVPRLNVHHKQLFFSDSPIFVEGILDAQLLATLQEARGVSVAGAGSCFIDAGGSEEVSKYLDLCLAFGKHAHFVYDLDSLFRGSLRACIRGDLHVQSFLASIGVGGDFARYCGELDRALTNAIEVVLESSVSEGLGGTLRAFLQTLGERSEWQSAEIAKARVALLTTVSRSKTIMEAVLGSAAVAGIVGRLEQVARALEIRNVHLLIGGTLERYLPSYTGNSFVLLDEQKRSAVSSEIEFLSTNHTDDELRGRYSDLFDVALRLPAKLDVNVDSVLRDYLGKYVHDLQSALVNNSAMKLPAIQAHLNVVQQSMARVFQVSDVTRGGDRQFAATVVVKALLGKPERFVRITHQTNAAIDQFVLETLADQNDRS